MQNYHFGAAQNIGNNFEGKIKTSKVPRKWCSVVFGILVKILDDKSALPKVFKFCDSLKSTIYYNYLAASNHYFPIRNPGPKIQKFGNFLKSTN